MRKVLIAAAVSALILTPMQAMAQGGPGGGGPGGGAGGGGPPPGGGGGGKPPKAPKPLKRDALNKPIEKMFSRADTNRDGLITLDEFRAIIQTRKDKIIEERFGRVDLDRNNQISQAEFFDWQRKVGSLVLSEERSALSRDKIVPETLPIDLGKSSKNAQVSRVIEPLSATLIVSANSNYDAGMSLDELLTYQLARFDKADQDSDSKLTAQELNSLSPQPEGSRPRGPGGPGERGGPPPS